MARHGDLLVQPISEYTAEDTSAARLSASAEGVRRFSAARLGLQMHWGLYSLSSRGNEWVYFTERIPLREYRQRMMQFDPRRFHAEEWADLMLESGQRFLLITSKHHDGFCLWDSAQTDFTVTGTPFARDIIGELAPALAARDLDLHLYYSLVDWTHPAYRRDWDEYVAYYQEQIRELCTSYGDISGFLFDGYWPRMQLDADEVDYFQARGHWHLAETYDLIHSLQPDAMVANNSHILPLHGEDYQIFELDMPGENNAGFNCTDIGDKPTATCFNLNHGWSYQPRNHRVRTAGEVLELLSRAREASCVLALNVGPRPFGDIHPEEQQVLREVGQAMRVAEGEASR